MMLFHRNMLRRWMEGLHNFSLSIISVLDVTLCIVQCSACCLIAAANLVVKNNLGTSSLTAFTIKKHLFMASC